MGPRAIPPEKSRRVFVQHSDDDGRTWSPLREITDQAKLPDWRWYATGPGHPATVGLLYETGEDTPYGRLEFRRIPIADLV